MHSYTLYNRMCRNINFAMSITVLIVSPFMRLSIFLDETVGCAFNILESLFLLSPITFLGSLIKKVMVK